MNLERSEQADPDLEERRELISDLQISDEQKAELLSLAKNGKFSTQERQKLTNAGISQTDLDRLFPLMPATGEVLVSDESESGGNPFR